jgi:acylphosphatase
MMKKTFSIIVKGIVQGVFYRKYAREKATQLGITGEVRNTSDGDVHIVATGDEAQLKDFIDYCNAGPETAVVADVQVEEVSLKEFTTFKIVR